MSTGLRWACLVVLGMGLQACCFADETPRLSAVAQVRGVWKFIESENFRCWSQLTDDEVRQLTESCELWRTRLRTQWISDSDASRWLPKCDVVVHPNRDQYARTLNRPGDRSVGSTRMQFDQGRAVSRRIDVRADASDWSNAALPHELTHVVLGERFGGRALPRWADEGMAMLSESPEKHRERLADLRHVLVRRSKFTMHQLTRPELAVEPQLRDAFYGQSLALASLLINRSSAATFADFVEDASAGNLDAALRRHYDLDGVPHLQREWDRWVRRPADIRFAALPIQLPSDVAITRHAP